MKKIESWFLFLLLGAIMPLVGFLSIWFATCQLLTDWKVITAACCGGAAGLILDGFLLKRWVAKAYEMDLKLWMVIFIFYSVCVFGFFMGVPVFNLALAVPAGFFMACRQFRHQEDDEQKKRVATQAQIFTTAVFGLICVSSAAIALYDPYTADNLEGMFRLPFELTQGMIVGLIVVGGAVVLAMNWWLTGKTMALTSMWGLRKQS